MAGYQTSPSFEIFNELYWMMKSAINRMLRNFLLIAAIETFAKLAIAYWMLYFLQTEKIMNCNRKIKYSAEELVVAISQHLGALSDSK